MLNLWDTLEGRKKRKKQEARVSRPRESRRKKIGWSKVKISWLAFNVTWCEECEREKRMKRWRNKGRGQSAIWAEGRKEVKSQSVRTNAVLKNCVSESKREEKNRESERKYTLKKRAVSEKKESSFLLQLYF